MKLDRMPYEPGTLVDFYEAGLTALGAFCSRPWHDKLEVLAEGAAARLWNASGALHAAELQFVPADSSGARDAAAEVFPGCPLTFRLAEALRPAPVALERIVLAADGPAARAPDAGVIERLWRNQFPETVRWRPAAPLARDWHFSLVALVRGEIQAIDQHWSLHRMALALPDGRSDEGLAREIGFARVDETPSPPVAWPVPDAGAWGELVRRAMEPELAGELSGVRTRQENQLRRELERVDDYFETYERELSDRARRGSGGQVKLAERLAAAEAEHVRHRADQTARHEIVVVPHLDALLLVAEPAWRVTLQVERAHRSSERVEARFVPRSRRWETRFAGA